MILEIVIFLYIANNPDFSTREIFGKNIPSLLIVTSLRKLQFSGEPEAGDWQRVN
jgi:hypothetical protein